jgi:hypothetical protein
VVSIPPKIGPNNSLYRYSNLREAYARKYLEMASTEDSINEKMRSSGTSIPKAFASKTAANFRRAGLKERVG